MIGFVLLSVILLSDGGVTIEGDRQVDPARSMTITVKPRGIDLRERFRGFAIADDYEDEGANATHWLLTPKPCEKTYKIAPFAYNGKVLGPVKFEPPPAREPVTGEFECSPKKDMPPLSLKLVGRLAALVVAVLGVIAVMVLLVRYLARRVKEHRMSPIERAWVELDRLIKKGLPGRGRYKDFYVELTMVVRRYVQRKYGVKAPHLTTEEFFREFDGKALVDERTLARLKAFLESADMIKFAGVEATPEMADDATASARGYLAGDAKREVKA